YPVPVVSTGATICGGTPVKLSASGGVTYSWIPSATLSCNTCSSTEARPNVSTIYTVTIASGPCKVTDSVAINVNPAPVVTACCDSVIKPGQNVQLVSSGIGSFAWSPPNAISCNSCTDPVVNPLTTTTYTLTVTSDSSCSAQQAITINVSCGTVFIPEAFSPNGDGQNDYLYVRGDCIKTLHFEIFDRWGNKLFETDDQNIPWDGRYKGEAMNAGSYVYYLTTTLYDGTTQTKKGNVTIVR
ncbi:MAG TPA: gliding motility-associated C-terminal domain-containing protein, partial [Bacteroidia bacterium]|nr:gliding motility-associated C-terminal domain-containing protein [Bacteroidia bacterium]